MSQTAPPDRETPSGAPHRDGDVPDDADAGRDWKQAVASVTSTVADAAVDAVTIVGDAARTLSGRTRDDDAGRHDGAAGDGSATTTRQDGRSTRRRERAGGQRSEPGQRPRRGGSRPTTTRPRAGRPDGTAPSGQARNGGPSVGRAAAAGAAAAGAGAAAATNGATATGTANAATTTGATTNGAAAKDATAEHTAPRNVPTTGSTATDATAGGSADDAPAPRATAAGAGTSTTDRPGDVAGTPDAGQPAAQPGSWRAREGTDTREVAWMPSLRRRREHERPWLVRAGTFAIIALAGLAAIVVAATALLPRAFAYAAESADAELILPDDAAFDPLAQRTRVLYADGSLLAILHGEEDRNPVRLDKMPDAAWQAVVAAEDRKFFEHEGYDPTGIGRALLANFQAGGVEQGGSTITQQVARLNFKEVGLDRSVQRKLKEVAYAVALEKRFTKEEILDRYVNQVYFGAGAYGLQAASEEFFDKNVVDIKPDEAALLAGLISSPSAYNPRVNPDLAREQRDLVLDSMGVAGYLTDEQIEKYKEKKLKVAPPSKGTNKQPSIVEEIMKEFNANPLFGATLQEREDNLFNGGLRIRTTIQPRLQKLAQRTVEQYYPNNAPTAAIGVVDPRSGAIKAAASSKKYNKDNFNLALRGRRQPGSAFKPFVMAEALRQGFSPSTTLNARSPIVLPQRAGPAWSVENYGGASYGQLDMAAATKNSVNTYYAQLIELVGVENAVRLVGKLGIPTDTAIGGPGEYGPAIVLGGLRQGVTPVEMASAYGTFANNGVHIDPYLIAEVRRGGKDLLHREPHKRQVLQPNVNAAALRMLKGPPSPGGTAPNVAGSVYPWPVAGKTGTTQLATDAWFVGTTPVLSTAVWVGHPEGQIRMYGATGGGTASPLWQTFMSQALSGKKPRGFPDVSEAEFVGKTVNVPNLIGLSEQQALSKLAKKKLIGRAQYQYSNAAVGTVIWASPSDSAQVGTSVYIGISQGPEPEPEPQPKPERQRAGRHVGLHRHLAGSGAGAGAGAPAEARPQS